MINRESCDPRDSRDPRDPRDHNIPVVPGDHRDSRDVNIPGVPGDHRDPRDVDIPVVPGDHRDPRDPRDVGEGLSVIPGILISLWSLGSGPMRDTLCVWVSGVSIDICIYI